MKILTRLGAIGTLAVATLGCGGNKTREIPATVSIEIEDFARGFRPLRYSSDATDHLNNETADQFHCLALAIKEADKNGDGFVQADEAKEVAAIQLSAHNDGRTFIHGSAALFATTVLERHARWDPNVNMFIDSGKNLETAFREVGLIK